LAYGSVTFVWIGVAMIELLVPMAFWFSAAPISGTFSGFSRSELLTYYALMAVIGNLTFWWIHFDIEEDIRTGDLSNYLLKPVGYFRYRILHQLADKFFSFLVRLPLFFIVTILLGHLLFTTSLTHFPLTALATISGTLTYMLISLTFGMTAFWLTSSRGLISLYFFSVFLFSGELAPLAFFPDWFRQLAYLLPFRYIVSFPLELLLNRLTTPQIISGFLISLSWLSVMTALVTYLWHKGLRTYQAYGK